MNLSHTQLRMGQGIHLGSSQVSATRGHQKWNRKPGVGDKEPGGDIFPPPRELELPLPWLRLFPV
jgi:hypothetical protein